MFRSIFAVLALSLAAPATTSAHAAEPVDGLAWQWNGQSRTYHIDTTLLMPEWVWIRAVNNLEVRAMEVYMDLVTTCAPEKDHSKRWFMKCKINDFALQPAAMPRDGNLAQGENNPLQQIVDEWKERLVGSHIEIKWMSDGRLSAFRWLDLERRNRRDLENLEIFRQLFMRAFAPMQMRMPKKGSDEGAGSFEEKNPMLIGYPAGLGGVGSVKVLHTFELGEDGLVNITSEGTGSIGHPTSTSAQMSTGVANTFDMTVEASGVFDTKNGFLVSREATIQGEASAGSAVSEGRQALPYVQIYKVQHLDSPEDAPELRENKPTRPKR